MALRTEIAILGAGPAAAAAACALRRLGHEVLLIGVAGNATVEGVSARTLTLLCEYGLDAAAGSVCGPGERVGSWAGVDLAGHSEYIAQRAELDRALLADVASSGAVICAERVIRYERLGALWRAHTERQQVDCRVIVDARGRRAQRGSCKGPDLIAVCQRLRTRNTGRAFTRVEAAAQGWCWLAEDGCGTGWLQVTSAAGEPSLRQGLKEHMRRLLATAPPLAAHLSGAIAIGTPIARAATPSLCAQPGGAGLIRAGDASVALDPLSGQGMYEALRSIAAVTGAVRGSLCGESAAVMRFLDDRARELWQRGSLKAAHLYGQQADSTPSPFWSETAARYRSLQPPLPAPAEASIEPRPVLNGSRIELRRVVVTPQTPRGVWKVDAVDLAELIDFLRAGRTLNVERAAQHFSCAPRAVAHAMQWLSARGLLESAAAAGHTAPQPLTANRAD